MDLELDHDNIRKEGNIMDHRKKTQVQNALHQERVNNLRGKLENQRNILRNAYNSAQPMQEDITQLHYKIVNAREFISDINDKYSRYWKENCISMMLNKLGYILKVAARKHEELENVDLPNSIQPNLPETVQRASSKSQRRGWCLLRSHRAQF